MTIRFTCDTCGSVLKIKDELAGTDGKCPKCKTRFVVPPPTPVEPVTASTAPMPEEPKEVDVVPSPLIPPAVPPAVTATAAEPVPPVKAPAKTVAKPVGKTTEKPTSKASPKPVEDDEFDPVSFLMEGPKKKPTFEADPDTTPSPKSADRPSRSGSGGGGGGGGFSLDDDGSDVAQDFDAPPPTRKWGAKKEVSTAAAADRSTGGSTNAARDLLARSMEESRVRASEMPEEKPRFNFDFAGFIREVGIKGIGTVLGLVFAVYGTYWIMNNMMGGGLKLPPLGYVSGTLTIGGKPAAGVKVYLTPLDQQIEGANEKKERSRDSLGVTDAEGRFTMYYDADHAGAKVGPCKLWMEASDPSVAIPVSYGIASSHQVEVKAGNNEPQKLEL